MPGSRSWIDPFPQAEVWLRTTPLRNEMISNSGRGPPPDTDRTVLDNLMTNPEDPVAGQTAPAEGKAAATAIPSTDQKRGSSP
jgi:hypothetical protein